MFPFDDVIMTLQVVARETQTAERYSSTATVILSVFDVDDNGPKFNQDEYDLTGHLTFGDRVGTVTVRTFGCY